MYKIQIKQNADGEFYYVIANDKDEPQCFSQTYKHERDAIRSANLVKSNMGRSMIVDEYELEVAWISGRMMNYGF